MGRGQGQKHTVPSQEGKTQVFCLSQLLSTAQAAPDPGPRVPRLATVLLLPRAAPWLPPSPAVSTGSCLWPELSPPSPPHCGPLVHLSIHYLETSELRQQQASRAFFLTTSQASFCRLSSSRLQDTPRSRAQTCGLGLPTAPQIRQSVSSPFTSQGLAERTKP